MKNPKRYPILDRALAQRSDDGQADDIADLVKRAEKATKACGTIGAEMIAALVTALERENRARKQLEQSAEAAALVCEEAEQRGYGRLAFRFDRFSHCPLCDKRGTYARYTRYGRHHKKGEFNYDKPIYFSGIELADRSVRVIGSFTLGCCLECWARIQPLLTEKLIGIEAEIHEKITGQPPNFKRYHKAVCMECGWSGHEGQMRKLPALMGNGHYPGGCPNCKTENRLFATLIKREPGWALVAQAAQREAVNG